MCVSLKLGGKTPRLRKSSTVYSPLHHLLTKSARKIEEAYHSGQGLFMGAFASVLAPPPLL